MNAFFIVPTSLRHSFTELFHRIRRSRSGLPGSRRSRRRWAGRRRVRRAGVGLGDILFGKKKLKGANLDKLFALDRADHARRRAQLKPAEPRRWCSSPSRREFSMAHDEMRELLHVTARDAGSEVERRSDSYGFEWLVIRDPDEDRHGRASNQLRAARQGLRRAPLAAAFRFDGGIRCT